MAKTQRIVHKFTGSSIKGLAESIKQHGIVDAKTGTDNAWNDKLIVKILKETCMEGHHVTYVKTPEMEGKSLTRFVLGIPSNGAAADMFLNQEDPFQGEVKNSGKRKQNHNDYVSF